MVTGAVSIDRTGDVQNLLGLARVALKATNPGEPYEYANKVLEIDPKNAEAWFLKGSAAGWSSTFKSFRVQEMLNAYSTAVSLTDVAEQPQLRAACASEMNKVAVAVHSMSWKHVNKFPGVPGTWQDHITKCKALVSVWELSHSWNGARQPLDSIIFVVSNLITGIKFRGPRGEARVVFLQPAYETEMRGVLERTAGKLRSFDPNYAPPKPRKQKTGLFG